jgi:hypothetical protein
MNIFNQIQSERRWGRTKCGVIVGQLAPVDVIRAFDLSSDIAIYRPIERAEADAIATHILRIDLAYGRTNMTSSRAAELWQAFMETFEGQDVGFATNAGTGMQSWAPATEATFDMGVLVIGTKAAGCLWIEDED